MSGRPKGNNSQESSVISILLVDDIPEARENVKKLLAFEPDFKVVGSAGTGREGVEMAKQYKPDIIVMDINMPDMDGLQATSIINKQVPTAAVIIMSVQDDQDYLRRAMLAGARDFLSKPVNMDELYSTIRTVYKNHETIRRQYEVLEQGVIDQVRNLSTTSTEPGARAGHIITVYSPSGGSGTTTIASSLASGLMKEDVRVLLVDADLQFADVGTFLNLQAQSTIIEVAEDVEDLDVELFENIVMTHDSGLKVLVGPQRPEFAEAITDNPQTVSTIIDTVRSNYDFIVVDTGTRIDDTLVNIFEVSTKILLTGTPTLIAVKNMRLVLDLFDQLGFEAERTALVLNRVWDERKGKSATVPVERVQSYLKRPVIGKLPHIDERIILSAINKGVPVIASDRNTDRPWIKQATELADLLFDELLGDDTEEEENEAETVKGRAGGLFGRRQ